MKYVRHTKYNTIYMVTAPCAHYVTIRPSLPTRGNHRLFSECAGLGTRCCREWFSKHFDCTLEPPGSLSNCQFSGNTPFQLPQNLVAGSGEVCVESPMHPCILMLSVSNRHNLNLNLKKIIFLKTALHNIKLTILTILKCVVQWH